jgi:glycine cleavage system H protein
MSDVREGYFYTEDHEWAFEEGGVLLIGISDYAAGSLGDIVYVDFEEVGTKVEGGNGFGTIESVKAAEDLYSPVSGTIVEINQALADSPEKINQDPYGSWMIKLKSYDTGALSGLMDAKAYRTFVAGLES